MGEQDQVAGGEENAGRKGSQPKVPVAPPSGLWMRSNSSQALGKRGGIIINRRNNNRQQ